MPWSGFGVYWVVLGGLENRRFKGLLLVTYILALVIYITPLLGRFGAFWRHCGGCGLGGLASRENLTIKTRDAGAHDVRGCAGACMCVRAHVCARVHEPPPQKKDPP